MVMKRNAMRRNLRQSIFKSLGRYIAIAAIIALGAGLFVGLLMTKTDMVATGQAFTEQQNLFDIRMVSNYGWTRDYVEKFSELEGIADAEGVISLDLIARTGEAGEDSVYRFYSIPQKVNQIALRGGRMPEAEDECLADGFLGGKSLIGQTVTISAENEADVLDGLRYRTFTIVGCVASPLYMDMNRGTTSVGSGSLENYYYIPGEAFDLDYFTEINVTIPGSYGIYTDEYDDALDAAMDALEPAAEKLAQERFQDVKAEVEAEYQEGYQEYLDGVKEYEEGRAEAEQELQDAEQKLQDAEQELKDNRKKLIDAGNQIEEGREQIEAARGQIEAGKQELAASKAEAEPQLAAVKQQLDEQYALIASGYQEAVAAKPQLESAISALQAQIDAIDPEDESQSANLAALNTQLTEVKGKLSGAEQVIGAMDAIQAGYQQLEGQKQQLAAAEAQLAAAEQEMWANESKLDNAYNSLMVNWGLWHQGEAELAEGWQEYEEAKLEAEQELADARAELEEAKQELDDAREEIDAMEKPDLYMLDRSSNVGYSNLDSSSDIVAGVSRVFPVFFLLVASLVCITTMTRMIDEERTQIGTLKALGYSNAAIIGKYMFYSGSGALLGCGIGIWAGCVVFPQIIWDAYCIMLYIQPNILLTVDWPLCVAVALAYTVAMLFVTWYCCRRTLEEEPAELIRPKAPDPGKKILLEYLPFWPRISFLNKVTLRNIFRYRQRLAMMLVGIGGCTALLLTGFGLRDSIVNVVSYQFENITLSDMSVYFRDGMTRKDREKFLEMVEGAEDAMFYHQSSVELEFDNQVKEVYMISGDARLQSFIDLHSGEEELSIPAGDEVLLSVGVAVNLGIDVGDTITLRNSDLETMTLTVSGIYDNHVYNYAIVPPETVEKQWGEAPEQQMAFVRVGEAQDVHGLGAEISGLDSVMSVSVSKDLAGMVRNMMDAMDLVIVVIVFCAALLAVIVLYNLTNININERIREIATIKVLGFNAAETAAYVFKENLVLTMAGALLGLLFGKLLLAFVMSQIRIDLLWFKAAVEPVSYLWSIALTMLSAIVVDFIFYFKLEKVNMAEALKSVE